NIPHGHAVSLTLPYFLSFNMGVNNEDCNDRRRYKFVRNLLKDLIKTQGLTSHQDAQIAMEKYIDSIGLERSISKLGIMKSDIDTILSQVNLQRAKNNPRQIDLDDLNFFFINKYYD
ncbi:MAG: iron-containing alcohol dehydrogenase, partial [Bacteroidales bacterium]|nr:iron-containing alcohol dehydrogenase [Bacteroidales bacterium]